MGASATNFLDLGRRDGSILYQCDESSLRSGCGNTRSCIPTLVGRYDEEHYEADLAQLPPLASLQYLMEHQGMNGSQLGLLLGNNRSLEGKILRGERQLSKAHIRTLAEKFKVNPALFL